MVHPDVHLGAFRLQDQSVNLVARMLKIPTHQILRVNRGRMGPFLPQPVSLRNLLSETWLHTMRPVLLLQLTGLAYIGIPDGSPYVCSNK